MRQLKDAARWPDAGFEEKAYQALQDERMAALDAQANDLLAKLDALGTVDPAGRARLRQAAGADGDEPRAAGDRQGQDGLPAVQDRPDAGRAPRSPPEPKSAERQATARPRLPRRAAPSAADAAGRAAGRRRRQPPRSRQAAPQPAARRNAGPRRRAPASHAPPPAATAGRRAPEDEGYTIDEIKAASAGFFGKVSANLGAVIEHLFQQQRPADRLHPGHRRRRRVPRRRALRQGHALHAQPAARRRSTGTGPRSALDVGGDGSKTLFLIYKLKAPEELYSSFTGVDGSAYLVGGVGATLVTNGTVIMAPIRSGVGLRLGANIGYIRFTPKATWNPF